jgi:squalene-hopene/tetraprenyl-beta-curcumene cyclase
MGRLALMHARASDPGAQERCERRAMNWLLGMQSKDGGWAAFDVDNDWQLLNKVPFADHNAMLDPTWPDITGRVLESLLRRGLTVEHPSIARGVDYLLNNQEPNGGWYGRWGVDYIYGAFLAIRALKYSRSANAQAHIAKSAHWLSQIQNADGGWGESCESYVENRFVAAPSTPSQTAWALIGLLAANPETHPDAVRRGLEFLLQTQNADGTWNEDFATGTGFPNVFYLRYTLYRNYFPIIALNMARRALGLQPAATLSAGVGAALQISI